MEEIILKDPLAEPNGSVLEAALGKHYSKYQSFAEKAAERNLLLEWNYYRDGNNWLCKVLDKKKNLCWLSVWNTGFKLTFYFTDKTLPGIFDLDISGGIKELASEMPAAGKLRALIIPMNSKERIQDSLVLLDYKKKLK
ncbi:DUF3788 family protein [Breznakiella homolactica]|uniref:DUF3788 family protein n=1 Tax=Breznakiella homolactica TaxID=2798577 RepID=A0A7T8BAM4_9SPIR|nr:DUF3788 family protein [Breznakiella homolactica]QQO09155.1 DUF3788 domain-containing protein [Breznakiella homolactica]